MAEPGGSAMTITTPVELDFDVDVILDDLPDVAGKLHEMRAHKPAVWAKGFGQPALLLLSHELVNAAFRDEDTFPSADFYSNVVTDVLGRNLQCMRHEEHRINRALVSPAFRQRLMPGLVPPLLEPIAHELIDRFVDSGRADLVADFTSRYPFIVITRLLGLPRTSEDDIKRWALAMLDIQNNYEYARSCSHEFMAFVQPILDARRTDPGDDLISTLATTEVEGHRLTDEEIYNFLRLLFPAGADTTYLGLGSTLHALLTHPDQMAMVRAEPDVQCRHAGEEGIRLNPPTAWIPRINPRDIVWHGIEIPAGAPMFLGIMAANRDPAVFPDPDRFDITRRPATVMTFGFGVHFCLGAALARAELDVALRVILERLPGLRLVDDDGVRVTGTIHHLLRGPNRLPVAFDPA
jgi:cytochrome P450